MLFRTVLHQSASLRASSSDPWIPSVSKFCFTCNLRLLNRAWNSSLVKELLEEYLEMRVSAFNKGEKPPTNAVDDAAGTTRRSSNNDIILLAGGRSGGTACW